VQHWHAACLFSSWCVLQIAPYVEPFEETLDKIVTSGDVEARKQHLVGECLALCCGLPVSIGHSISNVEHYYVAG
jgi:hypothetical protein